MGHYASIVPAADGPAFLIMLLWHGAYWAIRCTSALMARGGHQSGRYNIDGIHIFQNGGFFQSSLSGEKVGGGAPSSQGSIRRAAIGEFNSLLDLILLTISPTTRV